MEGWCGGVVCVVWKRLCVICVVCVKGGVCGILCVVEGVGMLMCGIRKHVCTVVSRKYAPPFAILALVQSAGGAYTRDATFSLAITPPSPRLRNI